MVNSTFLSYKVIARLTYDLKLRFKICQFANQCHFSTWKIIQNFPFFSLKNIKLEAQLLSMTLSICYHYWSTLLKKLGWNLKPEFKIVWKCTLCCNFLGSLACFYCKMPMFRKAGMREGGGPLPLAFQYLIFMV